MIHQDQGDYDTAHELYKQSLRLNEELGDKTGIAGTLGQIGRLAEQQGDDRTALRNYVTALAMFTELESPYADLAHNDLSRIRERLGPEQFDKLYVEVVSKPAAEQPEAKNAGS